MATNLIFSPPPLQTDLLSTNNERKINEYWAQWFNDLHFMLSTRNFQTVTSAQELSLNSRYIELQTTTATYAVTLPAPTLPNVPHIIEMTQRTGAFNVTMDLSNCVGGSASTTCTWDAVGDTLILISKKDKWEIIKEQGVTLT